MSGRRAVVRRNDTFRATWLIAALAVAIVLAVAALPASAAASCGGNETAQPQKRLNPKGQPPIAFGDSVMLLALRSLSHIGYRVDARGCRSYMKGIARIRHYKKIGKLGHLVVMGLGADWTITSGDINRTLNVIGPKRVLGLVVPRELGGGTSSDADHVRAAYRRHPQRVMLLDWVRFSKGHREWFQPDHLHLTYSGAAAYTKLLGKALRYAAAGEFPSSAHFPR